MEVLGNLSVRNCESKIKQKIMSIKTFIKEAGEGFSECEIAKKFTHAHVATNRDMGIGVDLSILQKKNTFGDV